MRIHAGSRIVLALLGLGAFMSRHGHAGEPGHDKRHGHAHGHGEAHGFGKHGNPDDFAGYVERLERADRAAWQKPDEVVAALGLAAGQSVCDIGAGTGYFSLRMARVVGDKGRVFAVDVEPRMLDVLRERIVKAGVRNVTPVLALPDAPLIPDGGCDTILVVDTYHHFPDGVAYLKMLVRALRPGGRIVNIDFHKREEAIGPPLEMRIAREQFLEHARAAGLTLVAEKDFLPHQYFLSFTVAK